MKNLKRLKGSYLGFFDKIVDSKYNPAKSRLSKLKPTVSKRYLEYMRCYLKSAIETLESETYSDEAKEDLQNCYVNSTKQLDSLVTAIKEAQDRDIRGTCQYCAFGKPNTMDHYLPKERFPEFSVLALNLIPCCQDCNSRKLEYWKDGKSRGILNFYADKIPDDQYLSLKISFDSNDEIPILTYYLDFPISIDSDLKKIIENHYKRLDLCNRYSEEAHDYVSNWIESVTCYSSRSSDKMEIQKNMLEHAKILAEKYGCNNWKYMTNYSLANNDRFLDIIISKINSKHVTD